MWGLGSSLRIILFLSIFILANNNLVATQDSNQANNNHDMLFEWAVKNAKFAYILKLLRRNYRPSNAYINKLAKMPISSDKLPILKLLAAYYENQSLIKSKAQPITQKSQPDQNYKLFQILTAYGANSHPNHRWCDTSFRYMSTILYDSWVEIFKRKMPLATLAESYNGSPTR